MRVGAALGAHRACAQQELDRLAAERQTLTQRDADLQRLVASVQREREGTEGLVAQLGGRVRALEGWLAANEPRVAAVRRRAGLPAAAAAADAPGGADDGGGGGAALAAAAPDALALVVPADDLSRQALAAQAEDLAIEDALAALDAALLHGRLPQGATDPYLRTARALARRQFFARARALKVGELQALRQQQALQQQQAAGGASSPQRPGAGPPPPPPPPPAHLQQQQYQGGGGGAYGGGGGGGGAFAGSGGSGAAYPRLPT